MTTTIHSLGFFWRVLRSEKMRLDLMNIEVLKGDFKVRWLMMAGQLQYLQTGWFPHVSKYSKQTCSAITLDGRKRGYDIMIYYDNYIYTVLWYSATMMVQDSVAAKWFLFLTFFDTDLYRVTRWVTRGFAVTRWVTRWVTSRQLQRRTRSTTRWRWGAWWCHHGGQKNWPLKHRRCLRCKMGASKSVVVLRCSDIKVI